jgi:hypothetical protein
MSTEVKSASETKKEDWMNAKWRPMMGWTYMATCLFDFILGPILYNMLQYWNPGQAVGMWVPLTLQGGGLYHIAMGAIIGVSAYGRTQEKLNGANNGGLELPSNTGTTYTPPAPAPYTPPATSTYTPPAAPAYKPAPAATPTVATSPTGKAMPAAQVDEPL